VIFRASVLLLALLLHPALPSNSGQSFLSRYGNPIAETYLVRPNIVASVSYGPSGDPCEIVISPKTPDLIVRKWPGTAEIDYSVLAEVEDELVPQDEWGRFKMSTFLNIFCMPENDCVGEENDWEKLVVYSNAGQHGAHYASIRWKRTECVENSAPPKP
jgi:hypothetical protein